MAIAGYLVGGLVTLGIISYFILLIYFPEWVGVTGKSAERTLASHREGSDVDETFLDRE